jgi:Protein of unknown function (DUF664)
MGRAGRASRAVAGSRLAQGEAAALDQAHSAWGGQGRVSLRWVLVHMIEEYARHHGHADLIRESIDGQTGERGWRQSRGETVLAQATTPGRRCSPEMRSAPGQQRRHRNELTFRAPDARREATQAALPTLSG